MRAHTIGIIGYGHFGAFLANCVRTYAPQVTLKVHSSRYEPDGTQFFSFADACAVDVLILAVPIPAYADTIQRITSHIRPDTIVCDVATVKTHTVTLLQNSGIARYVATHPMFGPESYNKGGSTLRGLRLVICASTLPDDEETHFTQLLSGTGLVLMRLDADTHDRHLANSLFLTHLIGRTITAAGFSRTPIDTLSFGYLMDAVESVAPDEQLFHDVYTYNPYCRQTLSRYQHAADTLVEKLNDADSA